MHNSCRGQGIKGLEESGSKALYHINGKMMIEYVIDALKEVEDVCKIVIVGPKQIWKGLSK